jgi:predicted nucleotidyltransferase
MGRAALPDEVVSLLQSDARIQRVELTGSRARGTPTALSDWDFLVTATAFEAVRDGLPSLTAPLQPVVAQWDRLSPIWCYMMLLAGPAKIDLIFTRPHQAAPPWLVTASTLPQIDDHFWDWALWLASKRLAGRGDMVAEELRTMHGHLLGPLGVGAAPSSLGQAVGDYLAARDSHEKAFGIGVSRAAEKAVLPSLRELISGGAQHGQFDVS